MKLFSKKKQSEDDYFMASQWTLMKRKLMQHKLAKGSMILLAPMFTKWNIA